MPHFICGMGEEDYDSGLRKVDSQGRIAVPPKVREFLGVEKGGYIRWIIEGNEARVRKVKVPKP